METKIDDLRDQIESGFSTFDITEIKKRFLNKKNTEIKDYKNLVNKIMGRDNDYNRKEIENNLNHVKGTWNDQVQGIGWILSEFRRIFFDHGQMIKHFTACG